MRSKPLVRVVLAAAALLVGAPPGATEADVAEPAAAVVAPQIILKTQKVPVFPPAAKAGRFSGSVMIEAVVLKDGTIGDVKVLDCTRPKVGFEEASLDAVKQWRFEPAHSGAEPVDFTIKFRLNFAGGGPGENPRVSAGSFTDQSSGGEVGTSDARGSSISSSPPVRTSPR